MTDPQQPPSQLTRQQQQQLERIVDQFEKAWSHGERPEIETLLPSSPVFRQSVLMELVQAEFELRRKAGDAVPPQDYITRFPELQGDPRAIESLVAAGEKFATRPAHGKIDDAIPGLKPTPARPHPQASKHPTVPLDRGLRKDTASNNTAANSASEPSIDTDAGAGQSQGVEEGLRLYAALKRGATLGNYVILDKLGQGGMGTVFRAEHRRMLRNVALKVLSPDFLKAPQAAQRFHREVQVAARLVHPNIVTAYDADEDHGVHFLVMEAVEGITLSELIKRDGPLPVKKAVEYVVQAARGLDFAHAKGIVHRDIKPGNLMLDQFGVVKVLDLGLARLNETGTAKPAGDDITDTGSVMGTIDYMSPEQALNSKDADHRADIYSLGCTLWFLLTGKAVFSGTTLMQRLLAHRETPIPPLRRERNDVSMELEAVFRRMVAKTVDDRYQSMADVLAAFEQCHLGGGEASAMFYSIVAPMTDGIPLAEHSFAIEEPMAPAPPKPPPDAGGRDHPKSKSSADGQRRVPKLTPVQARKQADAEAEASLLLGKRLLKIGAVGGGLFFVGLMIGLAAWMLNRNKSPVVAVDDAPQEPPALANAPFTADEARQHQGRWADFLHGKPQKQNTLSMTLVLIPAGEFEMGTPETDLSGLVTTTTDEAWLARYKTESPPRRVKIKKPYYLSAHEVTQADYERVLGTNPSSFAATGDSKDQVAGVDTSRHPVERVVWADVVAFCNRLSEKEGLRPCYEVRGENITTVEGNGYRLPTEVEWEYACRAGTTGQFGNANSAAELTGCAWYFDNSAGVTHAAGSTQANAFGLFDMHGNVWEWCQDWYAERGSSGRVIRGGSWNDEAVDCRSAVRSDGPMNFGQYTVGFRVVVSP